MTMSPIMQQIRDHMQQNPVTVEYVNSEPGSRYTTWESVVEALSQHFALPENQTGLVFYFTQERTSEEFTREEVNEDSFEQHIRLDLHSQSVARSDWESLEE